MIASLSVVTLSAAAFAFTHQRLLSYLRYFQQEEYNEARFSTWLREKNAMDSRGATVALLTGLCAAISSFLLTCSLWSLLIALAGAGALVFVAFVLEGDPRSTGKLTLKMTERASKIHLVATIIAGASLLLFTLLALALSPCAMSCDPTGAATSPDVSGPSGWRSLVALALGITIVFRYTPKFLVWANAILSPAEKRLQAFFVQDAQRILHNVSPFTIAITGSYGKTGAKSALGELLPQVLGPTFWPKKSINTVMGITRDIRENLKAHHQFAVIEMGAYGVGSIKKLCALTPPDAAIVTAVGIMHLERFGSEENVYRAKSELPQGVPDTGILVCNGDNEGARRMATEYRKAKTYLYGLEPANGPLDCWASDIEFNAEGTHCTLHWGEKTFKVGTPLLGRPALSNAIGAYTMACALGASPDYAAACLANLQPVDNRLVLDKKGSVTFIRDAYNSNPTGFRAALEILATIKGSRKLLITPGMVELGDRQALENKEIAKVAAAVCDLIIVVSPVNRDAILSGLKEANYPTEKIFVVDTREEGFSVLNKAQTAGDVVLIENDLGDLLEGEVRF